MATQYQTRMDRVLRHIDEHLTEDLTLDRLAGVAAFSKFHFHRQFAAFTGVTLHAYIQLCRLKHASQRLAFRTDDSITAIALDSGYASPEAFARVFQQRFGQTPSAFRKQPDWPVWSERFDPIRGKEAVQMEYQVRITTVPDTRIALLEHRGDPALIGDSVRRFITWRKQAGLHPRHSATFNIWYDDLDSTPPAEFRLGLAAATDRAIVPNDAGVTTSIIPGGRCAVLRSVGSDQALGRAATYLYAEWLPNSGEEPRDFPPYCQRITLVPDVAEHEAITDIFLPLR